MTEDEVDAVAQELAKVGGASWYPGRTKGPILRVVHERFKDRARVAIAALDRYRASQKAGSISEKALPLQKATTDRDGSGYEVGSTVVYRPPGDQRAISCRIERLEAGQAYLVPIPRPAIGWISLDDLQAPGANQEDATHNV